jgi:hypothetical protein
MVVCGIGRLMVAIRLTVLAAAARWVSVVGAADFGESPGCGETGCPGGEFITRLIGWVGQYSLWASFAAVVGGFGFWAWSRWTAAAFLDRWAYDASFLFSHA